ncbi:MAG: HAD family hydrolase [Blautia sp.]|uniref:HAD family hydrolase n=1 Tax=Blautia sp. TaxID=1955243 RepID=UPI002A81F580|nr:HAD family hydrolase [Blautia sp.]MDY4114621.1 HAD family hydrolase [Blautia sp.]
MDINTILFDLDGTLLPMDQEKFVNGYFKMLAAKLAPYGYEPQQLINAILAGIEAMIKNDGSQLNEDAFWKRVVEIYGDKVLTDKPVFEDFYKNEFQDARSFCGFNPKAAETVRSLKDKGYRVVLATNPLFPSIATESRIRWAGLEPSEFDLYTTYENTPYCKPNLDYYRDILKRIDCRPEECLMVGNDVGEDMVVEALGMQVFLLTDCLINTQKKDITAYPHGSFEQLLSML